MSSGQPHTQDVVDATVLAARNASINQRFSLSGLPRLTEMIAQPDSIANLQARFHWVDGRCAIAGEVSARLRSVCQRCLQPIELDVEDRFHVVLVKSEAEMDELPDSQDSMIADAGQLDLGWLTEEQLLLAMPLVPLHAEGRCAGETTRTIAPVSAKDDVEKQTPFANLRELMKGPSTTTALAKKGPAKNS